MKIELREKAIQLRRAGKSYSEILEEIPIAKSTLSLWLQSVGLSKAQKQRLSEKRLAAARRGAEQRKQKRLAVTKEIHTQAIKDVGAISPHELWLMGIMLYWAEGSKEKEYKPGSGVQFSNSDPKMIRLFLKWLYDVCKISKENISMDIFIHENNRHQIEKVIRYWAKITEFEPEKFKHIYYKKNKIRTLRKNTGDLYFGVLKVKVKASSGLNRRIAGWIRGICQYYWGVD